MKLIVGLGNPGDKYANTRHNLGYLTLDALLEELGPTDGTFWQEEKKLKSYIKRIDFEGSPILLAKPTTFMNLSGEAVSAILNYYKLGPSDMIVVYDELDISLGNIRVRFGGGSGGHNGVGSIIDSIGTDQFTRVRLGIGRDNDQIAQDASDYVLGKLSSSEKKVADSMIKDATKTVILILTHGLETYMSKYNGK